MHETTGPAQIPGFVVTIVVDPVDVRLAAPPKMLLHPPRRHFWVLELELDPANAVVLVRRGVRIPAPLLCGTHAIPQPAWRRFRAPAGVATSRLPARQVVVLHDSPRRATCAHTLRRNVPVLTKPPCDADGFPRIEPRADRYEFRQHDRTYWRDDRCRTGALQVPCPCRDGSPPPESSLLLLHVQRHYHIP